MMGSVLHDLKYYREAFDFFWSEESDPGLWNLLTLHGLRRFAHSAHEVGKYFISYPLYEIIVKRDVEEKESDKQTTTNNYLAGLSALDDRRPTKFVKMHLLQAMTLDPENLDYRRKFDDIFTPLATIED